VAKFLGLGYPGGPLIEERARKGDPDSIRFPRPMPQRGSYDFSFSGLKTAVVNYVKGIAYRVQGAEGPPLHPNPSTLNPALIADICAGFQEAVVEALVRVTLAAAKASAAPRRIVLAGGVACNGRLRLKLTQQAADEAIEVYYPTPSLCTDNAAMIAAAGYARLARGERAPLSFNADADLALGLT
jgi:N6-L-threonylcarbamoyladenine synthase